MDAQERNLYWDSNVKKNGNLFTFLICCFVTLWGRYCNDFPPYIVDLIPTWKNHVYPCLINYMKLNTSSVCECILCMDKVFKELGTKSYPKKMLWKQLHATPNANPVFANLFFTFHKVSNHTFKKINITFQNENF